MENEQENKLEKMRHSASHILAHAVLKLYPEAKLGIGPAIEDGFYYDFDLPQPLEEKDLKGIEEEMRKIVKRKLQIKQLLMKRSDAIKYLRDIGQEYKLELLEEIPDKETSFYVSGDNEFVDLCRGPHIENTGQIGPFKLLRTAGAYWRGDETKKMLTRIYGTAFETKEELKDYLQKLEDAEKYNHRKLGKQLKLFAIIPEIGQGLPIWLPRGYVIRRILEDYMLVLERNHGYQHIFSPNIYKEDVFRMSGHLEFYKDSMYAPIKVDDENYYLKPMNCPAGMMVYKLEPRSYRDLPFKLGEFGTVYRFEKSGELHGLQRVRGFTQNDAHLFCTSEQLEDVLNETLDLLDIFYKDVGFTKYKFRLSLADWERDSKKYSGDVEKWEFAESVLRKVLQDRKLEFEEMPGDAAFYGPKIDVQAINIYGKEDSISTLQLDFNFPEKFDITYIDEDGQEKQPYVIHRALIGSFERFFAFLIEHHSGDFPLWLAPDQVTVIPISDKHKKYATEVFELLKSSDIRVKLDDRSKSMQSKIRDAEKLKIPYLVILGDKEVETDTVSVRSRLNKEIGLMKKQEFLDYLKEEIRLKKT
ncbi:threonine--tRNA ligase [Candidatus Dojkabacteria bacterium]|uniref:Threonine--tRNA ligase n=1 Tax=Candidatus Dojkabacteria bacterium TaxID=2099670 RepID=A0A847VCL2_9BACT|nr:threonine--tRNA ligase [Candidatus Dojkabacteria bacterium]